MYGFDCPPSYPQQRAKIKVHNTDKKMKDYGKIYEQDINTSLAAPGALAYCLQCRTACNTSPPALSKMADWVRK